VVAHIYNSSYLGGKRPKDGKFEISPGKVSKTLSQKEKKTKELGA
jgi:hypothetical protein